MKREKVLFILSTVMMVVASITTVFAATYLYNSADVSYDNSVSHLDSTDVQGAIDELYGHSTDYTNANSRISTLESYFGTDPKARFAGYNVGIGNGGDTTTPRAYQLYRGTTVKGDFQYLPSDNTVYLNARDDSGQGGANGGKLALTGSSIKINNTEIKNIGTVATNANSSSVSVANASYQTLVSAELSPGTWIISYAIEFANNTTGRREILLTNAANSNSQIGIGGWVTSRAVENAATVLNGSQIVTISSSTTYYLKAYQTSGAALGCKGQITAVKIIG